MRIAETVTFGGSGLDRHAQLRRDVTGLAEALARGTILPVWRGKPLLSEDRPVWVPAGHPILAQAEPPVFLGMDEGVPRFAADLSDWSPEAGAAAPEMGLFDQTVQRHPAMAGGEGFGELRGVMALLSQREAELVATAKALLQWHRSHGFCAACGAKSDMVQGGWQRSCPSCAAQHFPRTDPVVIMLVTRGNSVLLGRSPGWPEGMFSLLAGFVEPGETIEAAVRREVQEETGVRCGAVSYLASQPWPFPASLMIGAQTEATSDEIAIDPDELERALWVTREELVQVFAGRHPAIRPSRNGAIAHFILRNWLADRLD
ncbi:NAD(+) diphosphatase [Tabrizicola sp.]|jgi:NAD+ diphosphatase|uniref:NAD(+) diphosphatase n=1 Tax=Tabrizicola sp. TaxID=2005166 RepID=UPI001A593241|nr:NAD(+) diphosphatase [Tabrizicola sp.]MBL9063141.1 NAD(+) diphosphatase [Tabrizicola sp.]